jgi:hypothetical protein
MLYSSRNGCFFYYDSVLYEWKIAEPTLLFLLGLESVTTGSKSQTDSIKISKNAYYRDTDSIKTLEGIEEIYDDIYSFLSGYGSVEDYEHYLKFNCYGLKLLLNDITGTGDDRTVPIIFKSDSNKSLLESKSNSLVRLSDRTKSEMSYRDLQAQAIYNIFNDIGYDTSLTEKIDNEYYPDYYIDIDKLEFNAGVSDDTIYKIKKDITAYNKSIIKVHENRLSNSEVYRLFDYKAMYAYALGVLYGCKCLGYSDSVIWRLDPEYWYTDSLYNLVRTAWFVFHFHWTKEIKDVTGLSDDNNFYDQYKEIQDNKIWNFTNDADFLSGQSLASDEEYCFCLYVNSNVNESEHILYSYSTNITGGDHTLRGSYLVANISPDNTVSWSWHPIDEKIQYSDTKKGVISGSEASMVRYIGNDPVVIFRAYRYKEDEDAEDFTYLSPSHNEEYYVYTGCLGWIKYDQTNFISTDGSTDCLYVVPRSVDSNKLHYAIPINTDNSDLSAIVTYYECEVPIVESSPAKLYGIYNKYIKKSEDTLVPTYFDQILSYDLFSSIYSIINDNSTSAGYSQKTFYNLSNQISLLVRLDEDTNTYYIWDGDSDPDNDKPTSYYGYSATPSNILTLYKKNSTTPSSNIPLSEEFRYNADTGTYWSSSYWLGNNSLDRRWNESFDLGDELFNLTDKTVPIYRSETKIIDSSKLYNNYNEYLNNNDKNEYVYEDINSIVNLTISNDYNFIRIGSYDDSHEGDSLYKHGITSNLCPSIIRDENNIPLVWYDPKYDVYWNGLFGINRWQKTRPSLDSISMYDTSINSLLPVFVNDELENVSIDGDTPISYEDFYSDPHHGIIRTKLQVFNPLISDDIIECYCDTKTDPNDLLNAIYCIPTVTDTWISRSEISALGYWFVDGTVTLYSGNNSEEVIIDDDHTD